ncbi:hypothetical protein LAZ67_4003574 [Cordylochernes scorpioides]|uniref:Reverse transcriptase domain-containing protein n=1 Tax=Cordylochernes scorpioides TaxID=51811 RepID=A0ABY6KDR9_9ARAC|nr:hypothetical protein LAZ67_4003574 [Cordylochernes scorpioides]
MQELLEGSSPLCDIHKKDLEVHFQKIPSANLSQQRKSGRISKMGNTVPGLDGISYEDLKRLDLGAKVLIKVYDICYRTQRVLPQWKESSTVLIYKKGNKNNPENWKPIALANSTAQSSRTVTRSSQPLLDLPLVRRKASSNTRAALSTNLYNQFLIEETKRACREIYIDCIDLTNTFDSAPQQLIFETLEASGIPGILVGIKKDLYKGSTTTIRTRNGSTKEIPIQCGVKQVCPLSPITFNLYIKPIVFDRTTTTLAYAEDLAITARSTESPLHALFDKAGKAGLQSGTPKIGKRRVLPTPFKIEGAPTPALTKYYSNLHPGVPTGFTKARSLGKALQDLERDVKKIDESFLTPWQKIDAIKTFLYPRLDFILRGVPVHKTNFEKINKLINSFAKECLNLP